jgi:hemin uptake protein HemP
MRIISIENSYRRSLAMLASHSQRQVLSLSRPAATAGPQPSPAGIPGMPALVDSNALLDGHREVLIRHGGEVYRLRHTRNDKLILTK